VVILDEPTAGVDVDLRRTLWEHMRTLNRQGVTVVLTTHYLEEAEAMCDEIAIIDQGRVVASGETKGLIQKLDEKTLHVTTIRPVDRLPEALAALGAVLTDPHHLEIQYRPSEVMVGDILDRLRDAGLAIRDLATVEADLEELFLRMTGHHDGQDTPT
jgi:ABC-2 type transport system ATP-binding protein